MIEVFLSQTEADSLIKMEKESIDNTIWKYPTMGGKISIPLISTNKRENFLLDISRGQINIAKGTYQNRARNNIILVRLDFGGPSHRNPDEKEIPGPHLHIYREGFGDKWAIPLPTVSFPDTTNTQNLINDFMRFCNIIRFPNIQISLF